MMCLADIYMATKRLQIERQMGIFTNSPGAYITEHIHPSLVRASPSLFCAELEWLGGWQAGERHSKWNTFIIPPEVCSGAHHSSRTPSKYQSWGWNLHVVDEGRT